LGQSDDFFEAVMNERRVWNGRYISNFLVFFSPLNWGGLQGYKIFPAILILFIFLGSCLIYYNLGFKEFLLISIVNTLISLSIMPDITEGIYWYTGAITYIPGLIFFLIGCSILFKNFNKLNLGICSILVLLFVISSGFNEIISLLGTITFIICFLISKNKKHLFFFILFIFILIYIISAPGNNIRGSYFEEKHNFFNSFYMSSIYSVRFIGEWLLNPAFIFWGVILINMNTSEINNSKFSFFKTPIVIFITLTGPIFICCFGPLWSTGLLGQYRTPNLASFLFVISYSLIIISNKDYLTNKFRYLVKFKYSFIGLLISICLWKNQFTLFSEFYSGEIIGFNNEMNKRYNLIKECGDNDCYLPTIKNKSKTLFVYPLVDNPENWQNENYQKYFESGEIYKSD
tara:strand:+ start:1878 stop:3083 length:1206 start_codon:yes stop_codon:yes gene_type:complete